MPKRKLSSLSVLERTQRKFIFINAPNDTFFELEDIAIVFGCSLSHLQKLRTEGCGPPFQKIGRTIFYNKSDVLKHFKKLRFTSTTQYN